MRFDIWKYVYFEEISILFSKGLLEMRETLNSNAAWQEQAQAMLSCHVL